MAGTKWISIFPENIDESIPRASAALLMNDYRTGYPFACMEAAQISAARTAASAVLAAEVLLGSRRGRLAVVGAGIISRNILEFFAAGRLAMDAHVQPARILLCGSDDGQGLRAL
ncbi:ornithine cyclodeaminase/alanine dehydrogenase-like protein (mu-crystallin family) [Streptomonospora salina]|uniref:Ornithine cyclodeaminase/alanine dehydrogenase-like protein (Mu-crystallin family) n=1 Tax=Streptomonospora salina TaxID=104205 RepID=A0A841ECA4_9ACTN|nr:ornithine cyclodeaminase/alanine dehydrogenase-like protein (mu-crystallin family) [Streptomonospora salina]